MLNVYILCFALNSQRSEVAVEDEIPPKLQDLVAEKREEMLSYLAEADDEFGERFLFSEEPVTVEDIQVRMPFSAMSFLLPQTCS